MIPILFEKNADSFTTNGLGRLIECTSCIVTEERNGIYELEFEYPITGRFYQTMVENGGTVCVWHNDRHDIQAFDIYAHSDPMNGVATFNAHHISYRLNNIIVGPFTASSPTEAISKLSTESVNTNPFTFWTNKSGSSNFELVHPSDIRSLLFNNEGSILDVYGKGEYEFDMFDVKLYVNRGNNTNVTIRYGKNLSDITKDYDESEVFTAVAPYWLGSEGEVVYPNEIIVYSPIAPQALGIIPVALDFTDKFDEEPSEADLRTAAVNYINQNEEWVPEENVKVDFVALWQTPEYENVAPLQRVSLCDTVSIYYPELGIIFENQKVIKVVYDVLLERYKEMELGERQATYAENLTSGMLTESEYDAGMARMRNDTNRSISNMQTVLEGEIARATDLITGGLGGYLVINTNANGEPQELLIMDTPDINTAVNVWRFNSGGLGHSHTGYNGPYNDVALTQDGKINATMITAGTLNANLIRAGYLTDLNGLNYWNLETGAFRLAANTSVGNSTIASQSDIAGTVVATDVEYGNSTAENTAPTSWTTNANWEKGKYLWTRVKMTLQDNSTVYSAARRIAGITGLGVASVEEQYYLSTSNTTQTGGSWSTTQQTWSTGKYYWTRSKITWSDGTTSYTTATLARALTNGSQSTDDLAAVTVVATDVQYGNSTAENTAPTSWTTNANWQKGKYLWTREKMTLKDGTVNYSDARRIAGVEGLGVSSVEEQYYLSTSNTTQSGGSWSTTQQTWSTGKYYWTRSKITWSDGTTSYTTATLARALTSGNQSTNDLDTSLNQQTIFNRLTNNGQTQGIYLSNNKLYINATYIKSGTLSANYIKGGTLVLGGSDNVNGIMQVKNASGTVVGQFNKDGVNITSGIIIGPRLYSIGRAYFDSSWVNIYSGLLDGKLSFLYNTSSSDKNVDNAVEFGYISTGTVSGAPTNQQKNTAIKFVDSYSCAGAHAFEWFAKDGSGNVKRPLTIGYNNSSSAKCFEMAFNGPIILEGKETGKGGIIWHGSYTWDNEQYNIGDYSQYKYGIKAYYNISNQLTGTEVVGPLHLGNGWNPILTCEQGVEINGRLTVTGTKNRSVKTDEYSNRLLYCYETPSPLFGDIGEGVIDQEGYCYIFLDPIFAETISNSEYYQVFLQRYGPGDCYVLERKPGYFVVAGEPGLKFGWELKAKQKDFDQLRLEISDPEIMIKNEIPYDEISADYYLSIINERKGEIIR